MPNKPDLRIGDLVMVSFPGFDTYDGWVEWEEYMGIIIEINFDDSEWKAAKFKNGRWYAKFVEHKTNRTRTQWVKYIKVLSKAKERQK